ncbi:hypothetical protein Glaag_3640 [Glaciecola sp. 4H-3-7+YE-5]|nr:hypothetical protein Glaag_3640 [Glaciecola sp. 4H-3-7+YE-5]
MRNIVNVIGDGLSVLFVEPSFNAAIAAMEIYNNETHY